MIQRQPDPPPIPHTLFTRDYFEQNFEITIYEYKIQIRLIQLEIGNPIIIFKSQDYEGNYPPPHTHTHTSSFLQTHPIEILR